MRLRGVFATALLATAASGCWVQAGFGPGRTAHNDLESTVTAANVAGLEPAWTASVGGLAQEPIISGGTTYVRSEGALTALNLGTGAQKWQTTTFGDGHSLDGHSLDGWGVPAVVAGKLRVPASSAATPATNGVPCSLVTIDPSDGGVDGVTAVGPDHFDPGPLSSWSCGTDDALTAGSKVVVPWDDSFSDTSPIPTCREFASRNAGVAAIDVEAASNTWFRSDFTWSQCSGDGDPPPPPPFFSPSQASVSGDQLIEVHGEAQGAVLTAYRLADCGKGTGSSCVVSWTLDLGAYVVGPPVVLANGDIAVALENTRIAIVDGASHTVEWTSGPSNAGIVQPLAATPTTIFAAYADGTVAAFPAAGCGASLCGWTWISALGSTASARPSIGGDVLYVGSHGGTLTALPAEGCGSPTCAPLWTHETGSTITGAPAIFNGTVVVGSLDGTVTAFRLP
jgi:outer membrane protein assembly factor BamB